MGNEERAKILSDKFSNRTLKAIALYSFKSCGNYTKRFKCANEILSSGGVENPLGYVVYTISQGCPKQKFKGVGTVPKEVGGFINGHCAKCDKVDLCIGYLVAASGVPDQELAKERLKICMNCENLPNCLQYFMQKLKISSFSLMKNVFLTRFRRCSQNDESITSLDLDEGSTINVKGAVKQSKQ